MTVAELLATETVQSMGNDAFQVYRVAAVTSGVLLVALAWRGIGAGMVARAISAAVGAVLLAYGGYLWFLVHPGYNEVYPFLFILPMLVIGYLLYSRVENREVDAAVRAQVEAERAARRAQRAAEAGVPPEGPPPAAS